MKKYILFILLLSVILPLFSQDQYATTSSGKKVILKDNGTWEYIKNHNIGNNQRTSSANKISSSSTANRTYITGPRGGCYYINRNGNKTYVDRSFCN